MHVLRPTAEEKSVLSSLVLEKIDPVLATGALLADIMLSKPIPIVDRLSTSPVKVFQTGEIVQVDADKGEVSLCLNK